MKKLLYLFILLLLVSGTSQVFSQNISVYPHYPQTAAICDGDQATLIIDPSVLPSGKTAATYKFYFAWPDTVNRTGNHPATASLPQQYTAFSNPPGNWVGRGEVIATDGSHYLTDTIHYTVYYRPIADFSLNQSSSDTQCFNGNSFCFADLSIRNPNPPSNPIVSCLWVWGDGGQANNCNPVVCYSYGIVNRFSVVLKITDDHGCSSTKVNPHGHDSTNADSGVLVVGTLPPDFKWTQVSGPCFKSCYRFKNLSPVAVNKVSYYQWDFGDGRDLCNSYLEPDSNLYTAFGPLSGFVSKCDSAIHKFDSTYYDTIVHCYCANGEFRPKLTVADDHGCIDSTRKTPSNSGGVALPKNIRFTFDITTTKAFPKDTILADSVCAGSGSSSKICFKQTPILFAQAGGGDFVWDFGDPNDPTNRNLDSTTWTPCHAYSGMGSFFPSLTIKNICPETTFYYYSATMVGPYRRFIDTTHDGQRDLIDGTISYDLFPQNEIVHYNNKILTPPIGPPDPAFDGQAMIVDVLDSVQMSYDTLVFNPHTGTYFAKYKMVYRNKYYGDSAYYFNTQPFTSPYPPYGLVTPDSIPVYKYYDAVPSPNFFVLFVPPPPPLIAKTFQTVRDSIVAVPFITGAPDTKADSCLSLAATTNRHAYFFNCIVDTAGKILDSIWYKFARSYNYGVRVLGPNAQIENPPAQIVINSQQKNQCGPNDTVDFVNATNLGVGFKARNVWRRWDFGDIYAPQCTSFSVPHFPHTGMNSWPPVVSIDSFAYYKPLYSDNDYLFLKDTLIILYDTVRAWSDAIQEDMHSDHFFINNYQTYQGKRNCNFSHDTLPRHLYPNWDTVYLWYRYGHDFMPWKTTGGNNWTRNPALQNSSTFVVKDWDTTWWGKPVYLNILNGQWSLTQDSSFVSHYVAGTKVVEVPTASLGGGIWVKWPRIDTLNQTPPAPPNGIPTDLRPGNAPNGLMANLVPDPFQMVLGGYYIINGVFIDTTVHTPPLTYTAKGITFTLPDGKTMLPGSNEDFFEYVFRRTIQKCLTVKLRLTDTLNNETADDQGDPLDITRLDIWDCTSEAQVQLVLGKPDARGMGKKGKECPGLNPTGYPALLFDNSGSGYPGTVLNCGRSAIWVDIDSLADRMDGTPCYLDAFTTWGVGTSGAPIAPGPGVNITPGGLVRNTFYTGMNWNPFPPSPWTSAGTNLLQYHMGGNAGTPDPADFLQGFVTIGLYIGNGQKDSVLHIWKSNFFLNQNNDGTPLKDKFGSLTNPATGQLWTYQTLKLIDSVLNKSTPPPVPIPSNFVDDSVAHVYSYNAIKSKVPMIRYTTPTIVYDTMYTIEYLDPNWPRCLSDTVWYHNFWHIKPLDPTYAKSPLELAQLREKYDTMWVVYRDSIQDSVYTAQWNWGDNTTTEDSFYYAGADITDGYYTHGVRRVRFNIDYTYGVPGIILDSTVWPCGVYGQRQYNQAVRFYKRGFDSIGFVAPDILILQDKCPVPAHDATGKYYNDTIRLRAQDTANSIFLPSFRRLFDVVGSIAPDTLVLMNKCPNPSHYDSIWYPHGQYSNYFDTLFLRMKDTAQFTQYRIIDTSLMMLPLWHMYTKTSWEIYGRSPGATITQMLSYIENTQRCNYQSPDLVTVGVIDTLHIYGADGLEDTVFCKNEPVTFIDSVRYFRYDDQITNVLLLNPGRSRGPVIYSSPYDNDQFDTIDFWARDAQNPSDTLINTTSTISNSLIEFRYFPGKWTNYDFDMATGAVTYLPPAAPLTGHWDAVLRGGSVQAVIPLTSTDPAYLNPYPGLVIFYPISGALGYPGIYVWGPFGGWIPAFPPVTVDSLSSLTDLTKVPIPTTGRTLIFNNGNGAYKQVGMFYWSGTQWIFICNSPYQSFPYLTHRLYWDFGDGSPQYVGVRPVHKFTSYGRFTVSMVSRDSVGHFDTCLSYVEVMKPVAFPHPLSSIIGCKDTASFNDLSYVLTGLNDTNTLDHEVSRWWWFTLKYSYPNGLQGEDTITPQSILQNPVWYYSQKGVFKIKLAILTEQGCMDTATDSLIIQGPRPAFKFLNKDTIGCKPFTVKIWNMADSFGMRNSADTPTLSTFFYWGDGQQDQVIGRRDTVTHVYADTGTYHIIALGRDALPLNSISCPVTMTPDTANGFQRPLTVIVKEPYYAKITAPDTVCVDQSFDVINHSDSLNYSAYRFERRLNDSALTFIGKDSVFGNAPDKNVIFSAAGSYKIILFPTNYQTSVSLNARCPLQDTITVTALLPTANFIIDTTNYPLYKFVNKSLGADYYQWTVYNKDGTPRADGNKKYAYPPDIDYQYNLGDDTGRFRVCLIAYKAIPNQGVESCPDDTCLYINNIYQTKVIIPNVYTPNGDGSNDFFKIDIEGELKYDLIIFNRWGTKVFISSDKNNQWNGKDYNTGSDCAEGTYFFIFNYKLRGQPDDHTVHGTITLIRN